MVATIVDWAALGKLIVYSFAAAFAARGCVVVVGLYVMFTSK